MTKQQYIELITELFDDEITNHLDNFKNYGRSNERCCSDIRNFEDNIERMGLTIVKLPNPNGIGNNNEKLIAKIEIDEDGFGIEKRIALFKYTYGIYGGCYVGLKDYVTNEVIREYNYL